MAIEVFVLGSGSAGNSALVRAEGTTLLVDAGMSARKIEERLKALGVEISDIDGILLTHEHSDHTAALKVLSKKRSMPVYANAMTARTLDGHVPPTNWQLFESGSRFQIGAFSVATFRVPHDAVDPVGFRISCQGSCFGILTDLGHATRPVMDALRGIQGLLIETNYDEQLLQLDTRRPWSVKQRIASRHGHLSNAAAAKVLEELTADELRMVILAHLSRDCNKPELALMAVRDCLNRTGRQFTQVMCAEQDPVSFSLCLC
jgi:phosphoribosyl 1,2-cyclic phosphodiesterase